MAYAWDNRYRIGIEEIDGQHKGFFDLLNRILEKQTITPKNSSRVQAKVGFYSELLKVRRYAFTHFLDEEEAMIKHNYPKFFGHKAEHDQFIRKMLDLEEEMLRTNDVSLQRIVELLAVWLTKHITNSDMLFGEHLGKQANRTG